MDRRNLVIIVLAAVIIAFLVTDRRDSASAAHAAASAPAGASTPLQVVAYASGLTGFFDPEKKQLYLYATDVKTPFMTVEVEELGKPLKVIYSATK